MHYLKEGGKDKSLFIQILRSFIKRQTIGTSSDSSGTTNENGKVHFKGWIIAILLMRKNKYTTTSRDGWLQLGWLST